MGNKLKAFLKECGISVEFWVSFMVVVLVGSSIVLTLHFVESNSAWIGYWGNIAGGILSGVLTVSAILITNHLNQKTVNQKSRMFCADLLLTIHDCRSRLKYAKEYGINPSTGNAIKKALNDFEQKFSKYELYLRENSFADYYNMQEYIDKLKDLDLITGKYLAGEYSTLGEIMDGKIMNHELGHVIYWSDLVIKTTRKNYKMQQIANDEVVDENS